MRLLKEVRSTKTRLMIVDDDGDLRMALADYFETRGFEVASMRSGAVAVEHLSTRQEPYDIVLTDLVMPGVDGLDVLKAAKQLNPLTQVVVMTGYSSLRTAIETIRSGAFDYLAKPFELVEIEIVVNRIIEHRLLAEENQKLTRKLAMVSELSRSVDSRLDTIETKLSRIVAILDRDAKTLT